MKKIWINIDPDHVDFSYLREHFAGRCEILAKAVPNDPDQYLPLAKDADVIISGLETWNRDTLAQIKGKVGFIQRFGMGTDNIDIPAASENGILVANILGAQCSCCGNCISAHSECRQKICDLCQSGKSRKCHAPCRYRTGR